jgi:hypothetical protein
MPRLRPILRLVLVAALLGAIGVGWWAYWQVATERFEVALENWAGQQRALGRTVEYSMPVFSGFPFAIRAEIAEPRIAMPTEGFGWQGPTLHASASPFDPLTIAIHAPGEHRLIRVVGSARTELVVEASSLVGILNLGRSSLQSLELSGADLRAQDSHGATVTLDGFDISIEPASQPPSVYTDRLLTFSLNLDWLVLPPMGMPLGDRIDRLSIDGRIMGPIPPGTPAAALEVWRKAGGTIEIENASGHWGPVRFEGDGTFALDEALQPQGAAGVAISGYNEAVDAMVAAGAMTEDQAALSKKMLGAFAQAPEEGGLEEVRVPLTLQNRQLLLGPIKFVELPPIEWPDR